MVNLIFKTESMLTLVSENDEPQTYSEALTNKHKNEWKEAFNSELKSLKENNIWEITTLPINKNIIKTRWIFKIKRDS